MDVLAVVLVAVATWIWLASVVLALCRVAAHADARTEYLYRSSGARTP
jgi:hypothetical protein